MLYQDITSSRAWLYNIAQQFYTTYDFNGTVDDWDRAALLPNLTRLRWVPLWPWNAARGRWESETGQSIPVVPGFAPWAALAPFRPYSIADWYHQNDTLEALRGLSGPWLIAALLQSLWLQAVRAGYWDMVAQEHRHGTA